MERRGASMEGSGVVDLCQHREGQGHSQAAARPHGVAGSPTSIASRPSTPALTQHTQQGRWLVGWLSARASAQPAGAGSSQDLSKGFRPLGRDWAVCPIPGHHHRGHSAQPEDGFIPGAGGLWVTGAAGCWHQYGEASCIGWVTGVAGCWHRCRGASCVGAALGWLCFSWKLLTSGGRAQCMLLEGPQALPQAEVSWTSPGGVTFE